MSLQRQVTFWIVAFFALVLVLWLLRDILLPFIAGLVLAYFLDPVADKLQRLGLPRVVATLLILLASILVLVVALILIVPVLSDQIGKLALSLPSHISALAGLFERAAPDWLMDILRTTETSGAQAAADFAAQAATWIAAHLGSLLSGGLALLNFVSLIVVTPIVAFYLINDWDRIIATVDGWLPREHADTIRELLRQINSAMAGFIRGQGTVCLILGSFYAIALTVMGLNFGLLIGLTAGLLGFVPLVGALVGGALSVGVALVQFWPEWTKVVMVLGIFAVGQFVEGNFLSPKLVGGRIGLHPVWLMFALFAFGYLFGFVGVLLAVPLAAAVGVLCRFAIRQYLASRLYLGTVAAKPRMPRRPPPPEAA